ncbi:MAG: hypothetical protein ABW167_00965 [Baekduia sp.]
MPGTGVQMKTIASLKMGDAIGSPNRILAVVYADARPGLGRSIVVPMALFPKCADGEVQEEPTFIERNYVNPGALVAVRERVFNLDGLEYPDAAAA